jgi:hypothetical protein
MKTIEFTSTLFKPIPGEDEKTNPGIYGQALAEWIAHKLKDNGYKIKAIITEDWGWLVMIEGYPFSLWVGCNNIENTTNTWRCFTETERNIIQRLFKKVDPTPVVNTLNEMLEKIINSEPSISNVSWQEI